MSDSTTHIPVSPRLRFLLWLGAVCALGVLLSSALIPANHATPAPTATTTSQAIPETSYSKIAQSIDQVLTKQAAELKLIPAEAASPLAIMRRASLGLRGTIPSLADIREWEALPEEQRLDWWIDHLLRDRRTADYLAERFARAWVGVENTPVILFRRRRLVTWASDQFLANRPYDQIVHELIAAEGVWTDHPPANFLTRAILPEDDAKIPQPNHLTSATARAFLGVRLDCAECHDHPFDERWRQRDYQQLAAFFGQARLSIRGIYDDPRAKFRVEDRKTLEKEVILPQVPYGYEWLPTQGSRREQLATWLTDQRNPLPARALANRLWAILFGRPLVDPVDDLPTWDLARQTTGKKELLLKEVAIDQLQPTEQILDILAKDLLAHNYDWQRTIRVILHTAAFQRASEQSSTETATKSELRPQPEQYWAEFPLTRLRPEQIIGALTQAANLRSIDEQANIVTRLISYAREADFVKRYGDAGVDEFQDRSGTIPQSLLLMNNNLVQSILRPDFINASHRIAKLSTSDEQAIELTYLALLTRRPTTVEAEHFRQRWIEERALGRQQLVADLYWTILNSTEFRWNH
jgi:hypothetical protein